MHPLEPPVALGHTLRLSVDRFIGRQLIERWKPLAVRDLHKSDREIRERGRSDAIRADVDIMSAACVLRVGWLCGEL